MEVDANGIIQSGPFQGHHIDALEKYANDLQDAHIAATQQTPAAPPQTPVAPPKTPAATLQDHAATRVGGLHVTMMARMEQDDEAEFSRSVSDYATFKPKIDEIKKGLNEAARIQKGVHRQLYAMVKANDDPGTRHHLFGEPLPPPSPPVDGEQTPGQEKEPEVTVTPGKTQEELLKQVAKPAGPPTAPPTGGRHEGKSPAAGKEPKLKASPKLEMAAKALNKPIKDYLLALEAEGVTQEQIDTANIRRSEARRSSRIFALGGQ